MPKHTKIWSTVSLSLMTTLLSADVSEANNEQQIAWNTKKQITQNQRKTLEQPQEKPEEMPPPCTRGSNYFFYGDLLIWQAHEGNLSVAIDNYNSINGVVINDGHTKNLEFEWDVGFRVGFDAKLAETDWDLNLSWLRFYTDADKHLNTHDTTDQLYPTQTHPADVFFSLGSNAAVMNTPALAYFINNGTNNSYSEATAHWRANLNQIDLDLGRAFNVTKWLTLRPHFGVRATWIKQVFKVKYENNLAVSQIFEVTPILPASDPLLFDLESFQSPGDDFKVKKKNRWWGLGPDAGLDILFNVGCGWSLFGNVTAAIEYGFHKTSDKDKDETLDFTNIHFKDSFRTAHPILDLVLGLNWKHEFCNRFTLGLTGAWEQHVYFSQNQFPVFVDSKSLGTYVTTNADLSYQGYSFSVQLGF